MIKAYVNKDSAKVIDFDFDGRTYDVVLEISVLLQNIFDKIKENTGTDPYMLLLAVEYNLVKNKKYIEELMRKGETCQNGTE